MLYNKSNCIALSLLTLLLWWQQPCLAQNTISQDTTARKQLQAGAMPIDSIGVMDTATTKSKSIDSTRVPYPNPKRAGLLSSLVPGMGQVYNKQYWKLPIVYAGLGVAGYFIYDNAKNYRLYRKAYIARIDGDPTTRDEFETIYPYPEALRQKQEYHKKYLDMSVLITGVGYILQILDAVTFAYLKDFDVSQDISLKISPAAQYVPMANEGLVMQFGLAARITLK